VSQTLAAIVGLRDLILSGELLPGERISENLVAQRLNASRTPVRAALMRLASEGLLDRIPSGGFTVRAFTEHDIIDAGEVRGSLEGLAARLAAERGVSSDKLNKLRDAVQGIDRLFASEDRNFDVQAYIAFNAIFHETIHAASDSVILRRQLDQLMSLPFASPSAFIELDDSRPSLRTILIVAQEQHRAVLEAIEQRQSARAEVVMREHAQNSQRYILKIKSQGQQLRLKPSGAVIHLRQRA
jgi:GntR family transcriptional regulator, vanillate catabolism transcriptional regulator